MILLLHSYYNICLLFSIRYLLDTSGFRRSWSVMRNRRIIGNTRNFYSLPGKGPKSRFAPRANAANDDINFLHTDNICFVSYKLPYLGGGKRRAFLGTRESQGTGRRPRNGITLLISKEYLRIVVCSMNVQGACSDVLFRDTLESARFKPLIHRAAAFSDYAFLSHN